jgi:alkanesulfonate monooxygenase SsuD/methylene tetrahydromethanopterin reductase-like flavin-dependent oxidoreductase (luciferase family)
MTARRPDLGLITIHDLPLVRMRDDWTYLDHLGVRSLWLPDHYAVPRTPELPLWETWTLLAALAGDTSRSTIGTLVTNAAMRNPAVLAKQATTVDHLSNGRLVIGLGAGFYEQEHAWIGVAFPSPAERVERLAEAAEILDRLLRGERFRLQGVHFSVDEAPLFPLPISRPRPPLIIAAFGEKSLQAVIRHGDGWSFTGRPGESAASAAGRFRDLGEQLDELAVTAGRPPSNIRRSYLAGFADEKAFSSVDAFDDVTGRLVEAGADEIVYYFLSEGRDDKQSLQPRWVDREMLERLVGDGRWGVLESADPRRR